MSYSAMDIARIIINYSYKKGNPVSNLKLQKLLYYVQAAFLVETGNVCFDDEITCWQHGPVVREVYNHFCSFGADNIEHQDYVAKMKYKNGRFVLVQEPFDGNEVSEADKQRIYRVVDALLEFNAWTLVDKTHEEAPWKELPVYNIEIKPDRIKQYFREGDNRKRIYGKFD